MSVGAVDADARVEVQFGGNPRGAPAPPLRARRHSSGPARAARGGDEVVDVEEAAPREALADAEARDRGGVLVAGLERRDESVARRTLGVDAVDEPRRGAEVRAELEQGRVARCDSPAGSSRTSGTS